MYLEKTEEAVQKALKYVILNLFQNPIILISKSV